MCIGILNVFDNTCCLGDIFDSAAFEMKDFVFV